MVLTAREKGVLVLLAAGTTEQAAAAELGLSRRTLNYTLRALMNRVGVDNRFQLAVVLGAARLVVVPSPIADRHPVNGVAATA